MTTQENLVSIKLKYQSEYGINFDDRVFYIFGELMFDLGTQLRLKFDILETWYKEVLKKDIEDITLDICSQGGEIYSMTAALDFYNELKERGILVNTRAQGICMSAATVVLSGGTGKRTAHKNTKFMLHDMQISGVDGTANQVKHIAKVLTDDQMEMFTFYAKFSSKEELSETQLKLEGKKWHKKFTKNNEDHYISAKKMLEIGLIDIIL